MELESIKKVLVKCPPNFDDAFNTFPFLFALSEEFPKAEINLLCEQGSSNAFNFLPFKFRAFERPKERLSLVQTHKFCANLNDIFNIDLFFDLENTINSSFMGYNFRARERVGYGVGWNKYFLTKNFVAEPSLSIEKKCVKLLELYVGKSIENLKVSRVRTEGQQIEKIEKLFEEPVPPKFILIMLDNFQNVSKQIEIWKSFFDSFQNQKFIITSLQDEDLISELFAQVDLGHNNLYMHKGATTKEMVYLLNKVFGVVSNNIWAEGLCNYFGVNALTFFTEKKTSLPDYKYFFFKPQRCFFGEVGKIEFAHGQEQRDYQEMNQIVDHIHFYFKL